MLSCLFDAGTRFSLQSLALLRHRCCGSQSTRHQQALGLSNDVRDFCGVAFSQIETGCAGGVQLTPRKHHDRQAQNAHPATLVISCEKAWAVRYVGECRLCSIQHYLRGNSRRNQHTNGRSKSCPSVSSILCLTCPMHAALVEQLARRRLPVSVRFFRDKQKTGKQLHSVTATAAWPLLP